jgi:hypothetical protein
MAGSKSELEKYQRAMKDILKQLDWCIDYLEGIQKTKAARALGKNRDFIAKQIDHGHAETDDPTEETAGKHE